ncbi:MAG: glycosyltransferase family 2 protein [Pseudomonadota bacterium]
MAERAQMSRQADASDRFATVGFPLKAHVSPHGRVTALSMMKDEGPFVLEWVAHHLGLGFTDLVVYTNDCTDGTDAMLTRLEELGLVHHRRNVIPEGMRPQPSALKHAQQEPVVLNSDWLLVFDADEFLCIRQGDGTVDSLISAARDQGANGIVITWRIFGSDGIQTWSRAPVTEQYLHAAPPMWNKGWGVKTLFKYDPEFWKLGIHRPKIRNKHLDSDFPHTVKWLNGSGRPMEEYFKFRGWRSIMRTVGYDWAQMNHYAIKSMDSYAIRKFRGNVNNKADKYNADYWALQDRNEVHDDAALAHREKRREILDLLLGDPVLAALHATAVDAVEARLAAFKETPEYAALISDLKAASEIPISDVDAKPPQPRDPKKIAARMSQIEKTLAKRPAPAATALSVDAQPYLTGHIDLSRRVPLKGFDNHQISLPTDTRVFSPAAVQAITEGKFLRNPARRLPGLVTPGDSYLEIGAGAGFLPALLARHYPELRICAQEEHATLLATARMIWAVNGISETPARRLSPEPLFEPMDDRHSASGLRGLLAETGCTFLLLNDPRLNARMIAGALEGSATLRCVIAGPRALANACEAADLTSRMTRLGYQASPEQPLTEALLYRRDPATAS